MKLSARSSARLDVVSQVVVYIISAMNIYSVISVFLNFFIYADCSWAAWGCVNDKKYILNSLNHWLEIISIDFR